MNIVKKYICPNCESRNAKPYCNECDCSIPNNSFIEEAETNYSHISISNTVSNIEVRCPSCDRKLPNNKKTCPYCGELLLNGTKYQTTFEAKENANKIIEAEREKQAKQWGEMLGYAWAEIAVAAAILYFFIHLLVKIFF